MNQTQIATTLLEARKADGTMIKSRYWLSNDQMKDDPKLMQHQVDVAHTAAYILDKN
jgi:hypothetical protein